MNQSFGGFMIIPDFSVGEILGRSISLLMQNPLTYLGLPLLALLPGLLVRIIIHFTASPLLGLVTIISPLLMLCLQGAVTYAVYQGLRGEKAGFRESIWRGLARFFSILWASILIGLSFYGCIMIVAFSASTGVAIISILGVFIFIFLIILLCCMLLVSLPVCVVEKQSALNSIRRSVDLTKGYRLKIFALLLIVFLCTILFYGLAIFIVALSAKYVAIITIMLTLTFIIPTAFTSVMIAVIYYNLRQVKEGASLDSLTGVFD